MDKKGDLIVMEDATIYESLNPDVMVKMLKMAELIDAGANYY